MPAFTRENTSRGFFVSFYPPFLPVQFVTPLRHHFKIEQDCQRFPIIRTSLRACSHLISLRSLEQRLRCLSNRQEFHRAMLQTSQMKALGTDSRPESFSLSAFGNVLRAVQELVGNQSGRVSKQRRFLGRETTIAGNDTRVIVRSHESVESVCGWQNDSRRCGGSISPESASERFAQTAIKNYREMMIGFIAVPGRRFSRPTCAR